jgi:hypothetical protein
MDVKLIKLIDPVAERANPVIIIPFANEIKLGDYTKSHKKVLPR